MLRSSHLPWNIDPGNAGPNGRTACVENVARLEMRTQADERLSLSISPGSCEGKDRRRKKTEAKCRVSNCCAVKAWIHNLLAGLELEQGRESRKVLRGQRRGTVRNLWRRLASDWDCTSKSPPIWFRPLNDAATLGRDAGCERKFEPGRANHGPNALDGAFGRSAGRFGSIGVRNMRRRTLLRSSTAARIRTSQPAAFHRNEFLECSASKRLRDGQPVWCNLRGSCGPSGNGRRVFLDLGQHVAAGSSQFKRSGDADTGHDEQPGSALAAATEPRRVREAGQLWRAGHPYHRPADSPEHFRTVRASAAGAAGSCVGPTGSCAAIGISRRIHRPEPESASGSAVAGTAFTATADTTGTAELNDQLKRRDQQARIADSTVCERCGAAEMEKIPQTERFFRPAAQSSA